MSGAKPTDYSFEQISLFNELFNESGEGDVVDRTKPTGPRGPSVRVRMTVAYHGAGFSGFAINPGVRTVGGVLVKALEQILSQPVVLAVAGRTDAGVHAWGQVISFDTDHPRLDLVRLSRSLNKMCAPAIAVRDAAIVSQDFDARHSAVARRYRYTIMNRPEPDPFLADRAWRIEAPLDLAALRLGCDPLIGMHDFSAFCRCPKVGADAEEPTMVRRVVSARWHELEDGLLRFDIEASAFCQQMVRSIVGTLVDMGLGKKRAGEMRGILNSQDRVHAGQIAPPHGLVLWEVLYGG